MILDDLANEFDLYAPSFGEKYAPPFMPISIRDYAGNEINRVPTGTAPTTRWSRRPSPTTCRCPRAWRRTWSTCA